jgi:DNA-binding XRE family transcriptional regulator
MKTRKSAFMKWVDGKIRSDAELNKMVDESLAEMRIEQELAALRERRGMTQRELAARMGVSQPAIAKLESGRVRNLELRTLCRWATALGGQLKIDITGERRRG